MNDDLDDDAILFTLGFPPREVMRIDSNGFKYEGQLIQDAGMIHALMTEFLRNQNTTVSSPEDYEHLDLSPAPFSLEKWEPSGTIVQ